MKRNQEGHDYGGIWTAKKARILQAYLEFYTTVVTRYQAGGLRFDTWYIDAFAGTGERTVKLNIGGLFDDRPIEEISMSFEGSAQLALQTRPPFDHYRLIEDNSSHYKVLKRLQAEFPGRDVQCVDREANEALQEMFLSPAWCGPAGRRKRAVVFLDPYGIAVDWVTLEALAATKVVDVIYFFNLEGVTRQCALSADRIDASKHARITAVYGSRDWETEFYRPTDQGNLFAASANTRAASKESISRYTTRRLADCFAYVSEPIVLNVEGRGHAYSLYIMSNSGSSSARDAIVRGFRAVSKLVDLKLPMPAFHRTSDPEEGAPRPSYSARPIA